MSEFRKLTQRLLDNVNALDFDGLRAMVDDDYGIVDVDPEGKSFTINDMQEWEGYMRQNMGIMQQMQAKLDSEILEYSDVSGNDMAYSVVKFRQDVTIANQKIQNYCIATIIWKKAGDEWKESRWHCSLEKKEVETLVTN